MLLAYGFLRKIFEVFEKYPHLTDLHKEEMFEEHEKDKVSSVKESTYKREILKG